MANLGLDGDPEVSHNATSEAVRHVVGSLCLGGGFPVAWWGDLRCAPLRVVCGVSEEAPFSLL